MPEGASYSKRLLAEYLLGNGDIRNSRARRLATLKPWRPSIIS